MALSRRDELLSYISDAFKDVNGFRPRGFGYNDMSDDELEAAAEKLSDEVVDSINEERNWELEARANWEAAVASAIGNGAPDRESAVRWLFDAEGFDENDLWDGASGISYKLGCGFNYNLLAGAEDFSRDFNYDGLLAKAA